MGSADMSRETLNGIKVVNKNGLFGEKRLVQSRSLIRGYAVKHWPQLTLAPKSFEVGHFKAIPTQIFCQIFQDSHLFISQQTYKTTKSCTSRGAHKVPLSLSSPIPHLLHLCSLSVLMPVSFSLFHYFLFLLVPPSLLPHRSRSHLVKS